MKKTSILCLFGLILLGSSAWSQTKKSSSTEQAVTALEQQWLQAQKTNNTDLLPPLLAENFVETSSDGKLTDKAATIASAKSTKWSSAEYNDVKVRVFGNTAIATGGFRGKGTDESNKPVEVNERWTDTWVKMPNGKWQCVASQATSVKM
jgi:ketosteroid isomerase-like protein